MVKYFCDGCGKEISKEAVETPVKTKLGWFHWYITPDEKGENIGDGVEACSECLFKALRAVGEDTAEPNPSAVAE